MTLFGHVHNFSSFDVNCLQLTDIEINILKQVSNRLIREAGGVLATE